MPAGCRLFASARAGTSNDGALRADGHVARVRHVDGGEVGVDAAQHPFEERRSQLTGGSETRVRVGRVRVVRGVASQPAERRAVGNAGTIRGVVR